MLMIRTDLSIHIHFVMHMLVNVPLLQDTVIQQNVIKDMVYAMQWLCIHILGFIKSDPNYKSTVNKTVVLTEIPGVKIIIQIQIKLHLIAVLFELS